LILSTDTLLNSRFFFILFILFFIVEF
jgi:hypothetical protein